MRRDSSAGVLNSFVLTLDMDWAPDCVLETAADILIKKGIRTTWFVTHDSPAVRMLFKHKDIFEFGLHPNFFPNSTQGTNEREVMTFLRSILPDSKIMRSHAVFQSCHLLSFLVREFGIEIDCTVFLHKTPNIQPHTLYFNNCSKGLLRIPFLWEDDVEICNPHKSWDFHSHEYGPEGLKIFDFHPMYIYLNSDKMGPYEELKKVGPLFRLDVKTIKPFINESTKGAGSLFSSFVDFLSEGQVKTYTISDIAAAWKNKTSRDI